MSEIEVSTEDMALASEGVIPDDTYEDAKRQIVQAHAMFKTVAKECSKRNILRAIELAFIGGEIPKAKREELHLMSHMMQKIVEGVIVCKGYEMQNEDIEEYEGECSI